MIAPATSATLLRTNFCQISRHWPAAAIDAVSPPGFSGLTAGPVSASPSMKVCAVIR